MGGGGPVLPTIISHRYGQRGAEPHRQKGLGLKNELLTVEELAAEIPVQWLGRMARFNLAKVQREAIESAFRHVFTYEGRPLQRISWSFKTALKDAGISGFRFHDLRHCASTNL